MYRKWILPAAGAVLLGITGLLFVKGFLHTEKPKADLSIGTVLLKELDEQNPEEIQSRIQTVQAAREEAARIQREKEEAELQAQHEAEAAAQAAADAAERAAYMEQWGAEADAMADADQFKSVFANSVVIGDSIAYGILQTDLMLSTSVVAQIGANLKELLDYIPQVQSLNPRHLFLYVGFNDIGMCMGDTDQYYRDFVTFVTQLQAACPGVPVYLNHLVRVRDIETLENELYLHVDEYNAIIDQIASEYGLGVIETEDLVKEEYYYKDGYHMVYSFYPKWLRRMAETGGLM